MRRSQGVDRRNKAATDGVPQDCGAGLADPPRATRSLTVRQGDGLVGRQVNYAARVASAALGGEVLVSAVVQERLGGVFVWDPGQAVTLKGFDGEHRMFATKAAPPRS